MKQIVLASGSPRRRELLAALLPDFQVVVPNVAETTSGDARDDARRLAEEKAWAVAASLPGAVVIAADTLVHDAIRTYGKPQDAEDATAMLARLRGRNHTVTTAVAVVANGQAHTSSSDATVRLLELSHAEIASFVATGIPLDKAGAYAIQEDGIPIVERWDGCYCGVMGLPLWRLRSLLAQAGVRCGDPSASFQRCAACPERELSREETNP